MPPGRERHRRSTGARLRLFSRLSPQRLHFRASQFAHFAGADSGNVGVVRRRTGEPMLTVTQVTPHGDSLLLTQDQVNAVCLVPV